MKKIVSIVFFFIVFTAIAQEKGTIQGVVLDKEVNYEPLAFATVSVKGTQMNAISDLDGVHTLKIYPGTYTLVFNFPGYQKVEVPNIIVKKDQITHIKDISLSAMTLTFSQDIGEKEETSEIKR